MGQYILVRELGKGAMATVYEARHVELGKRVALKAMHSHLASDKTASSRFLREGRAAAQIHNPYVVDVFDVGVHDGVPYLVMELLDGADLAALLRERGKLPLRELADLMLPVASAVHAAHEVGVIHRDLKPSNVVLAKQADGGVSPTILDFGISKVTSDVIDRDLTASEVLLGTVHYMSPEQTRGGRNASALSDQYALGVMLYECATGVKPFTGSTPYSLMHAIVSAKVSPPSSQEPTLVPAFDEVVQRAMHRDPDKRFPSVKALGTKLLPWASEQGRARWVGEFGVDAESAGPPRSPRRLVAGLGLVVLLAASALVMRSRSHGAPSEANAAPAAPPTVETQAEPAPNEVPAPSSTTSAAGPPASPVASAPPAPTHTAPRAIAAPPLAPRHVPPAPPSGSAPETRPERGTNGALIVE